LHCGNSKERAVAAEVTELIDCMAKIVRRSIAKRAAPNGENR
jgi:hypothetical protein